jgi:hypothetical protein
MKVVAICVLLTLIELLVSALIVAPGLVLRGLRSALAGAVRRTREAMPAAGSGSGRSRARRTENARP